VRKNEFFRAFGSSLEPQHEDKLAGFSEESTAKEILKRVTCAPKYDA
jgi:hypothetical protein